jgi:tryptophanyl-tRNA synthetase
MGIVTDSTPLEEPKNPATCNVFALYRLFATEEELASLTKLYENPTLESESRKGRAFGYGDAKKVLLAKIDDYFKPAREKRKQLTEDDVEAVLKAGAVKARATAKQTIALVRRAVGMLPAPV